MAALTIITNSWHGHTIFPEIELPQPTYFNGTTPKVIIDSHPDLTARLFPEAVNKR